MKSQFSLRFAALITLLLLLAAVPEGGAAERPNAFGRASLEGSGDATMQVETVPARVSRVVVRPGSNGREVWGLGTSTARAPGWRNSSTLGQVVFLKYTQASGWRITGAPRARNGAVFNPALGAFALSASGEGWAVGESGLLLHKAPGSDRWVEHSQSGLTEQTLTSVSLTNEGGRLSGFAAGVGPTILRLVGGRWMPDAVPAEMAAQTSEITAISAVSDSEAYAVATGQVTGVDSTSLLVFRRTSGGWARITTGQPIFDNAPANSPGGGINRGAEAGAVAADASGAWIGGRMHPRSAGSTEGDASPGDASRAFAIRFDARSGTFTSYCPDIYSDRAGSGNIDLTRLCDQPFPTAPHHITSFALLPGGNAFAGGAGLFRFRGDGWYREPNANGYLISIAMASHTEGWVASSGRSLGAGGLIRSSMNTLGHWTASGRDGVLARWPQPQEQLLEAVALAGDGSGRAIAVGQAGAGIINQGTAWDSVNPEVGFGLHAVAWPVGGKPWAVGQNGIILELDGLQWKLTLIPSSPALFGIAFRSPSEGVAVGLGGSIVEYRNGVWKEVSSPTPKDLYAVTATRDGYVAVGRDAVVVEGTPGRWSVRRDATSLLGRPQTPEAPTLYAVTQTGSGDIVMGGQDSSLVVRTAGGRIRSFDAPIQGTVLALGSSGHRLVASVSPNDEKYRGAQASAQRGALLAYESGAWRDVSLNRKVTLLRDAVDTSEFDDPVYSIGMITATTGWAVGGSPAELKDQAEGHFRTVPTGSVYRIGFGIDPAPAVTEHALDEVKADITFAAFGESWCGVGLCSAALGTGTMADKVALRIRDEINSAGEQPGGPSFVVFTGNMRRTGIPEELEQFRKYLQGFRIPIFAAPGSLDRFTGLNVALPGAEDQGSGGSNDFWKEVFAQMPQPWGSGKRWPGLREVSDVAGFSTVAPQPGRARTHYAFDVLRDGKQSLRVVIIDSSTRSYGNASEQNPQEDQGAWLKAVLGEASDVLRIPSVVVMNQPPYLPAEDEVPNWSVTSQPDFESTVVTTRVSLLVTGGPRLHAKEMVDGVVPMYYVGGGGAPFGKESTVSGGAPATKVPTDGYFHGWHLVNIDPKKKNLLGQASVGDQVFPILESVALHSLQGTVIPAGQTADISALGRGLNGGFSDPEQSKAAYLVHGRGLLPCGYEGEGDGVCIADSAVLPHFTFVSRRPDIADFVVRDPLGGAVPRRIDGKIVRDPGGAAGLLCAFKKGKAPIDVIAGAQRSTMVIEVIAGFGACVDAPVPPDRPVVQRPQPEPPRVEATRRTPFFRTPPHQEVAAVFPPPPAPVVAPAPPGAPGVGRKEEHEVEYETESHDEGHRFTAIHHEARSERAVENTWPIFGSLIMLSFCGAVVAAAVAQRRSAPTPARSRRWLS